MRAVAPALVDLVADMPFAAVDAIHTDPTDPMPTHDRGTALRELPAEAVDALLDFLGRPASERLWNDADCARLAAVRCRVDPSGVFAPAR
ncbi:hypothetical protein ACI79D_05450 [Geodermatophilus sp. SYSU D00708]